MPLNDGLRSISAPRKSESNLRRSEINDLIGLIDLFGKGAENRIRCAGALGIGEDTRIGTPHVVRSVFMDIVDQTLMGWHVHLEEFHQEMLERWTLKEKDWWIMASEVDWCPIRGLE